jgi:hypothetical protein
MDSATAAGWRVSGFCSNGEPSIFSPMRSSTTDRASRLISRWRFGLLAREGMIRLRHPMATKKTRKTKRPWKSHPTRGEQRYCIKCDGENFKIYKDWKDNEDVKQYQVVCSHCGHEKGMPSIGKKK